MCVPRVTFTANLQRHLESPPSEVAGSTVREALAREARRTRRSLTCQREGDALEPRADLDPRKRRRHALVRDDPRRTLPLERLGRVVEPGALALGSARAPPMERRR